MKRLLSLYKFVMGIAAFCTGLFAVFAIIWFATKKSSILMIFAPLGLGIVLAVFETKCMYKKGIGILAAILFAIQMFLSFLSDYFFELDESVGFLEALMADNKSHIYDVLPSMGIVFLIYAAGFALNILVEKQQKQKQIEEDEIAQKVRQERETAERAAREEAYYKDFEDRQRAYDRFQRDHQNTSQSFGGNRNTSSNVISEYEKAKVLFGLDSDNYTLQQIKDRRNMLIRASHPDGKDGDTDYTQKINRAYQILKEKIQ